MCKTGSGCGAIVRCMLGLYSGWSVADCFGHATHPFASLDPEMQTWIPGRSHRGQDFAEQSASWPLKPHLPFVPSAACRNRDGLASFFHQALRQIASLHHVLRYFQEADSVIFRQVAHPVERRLLGNHAPANKATQHSFLTCSWFTRRICY